MDEGNALAARKVEFPGDTPVTTELIMASTSPMEA